MRNKKGFVGKPTLEFSLRDSEAVKPFPDFIIAKNTFFTFLFVLPRVALSDYRNPTYRVRLPHPRGIFQKKIRSKRLRNQKVTGATT